MSFYTYCYWFGWFLGDGIKRCLLFASITRLIAHLVLSGKGVLLPEEDLLEGDQRWSKAA